MPFAENKATDKYYIRYASMLFPDVIETNDRDISYGHMHSILQLMPRAIKKSAGTEPSVKNIEASEARERADERIVFDTKINDVSVNRTVQSREGFDKYSLEIGYTEGDYIVSFWGDKSPVQLGESMYYRIQLENGKINSYDFEVPNGFLDNIKNFYCVVSPENNSSDSILISKTLIFLDEDESSLYEPGETEITGSESLSEPTTENDNNIEYGISPVALVDDTLYGTKGRGQLCAYELKKGKIKGSFEIADGMIELSSCRFFKDNVFIVWFDYSDDKTYVALCDSGLNKVYQSSADEVFNSFDMISIIGSDGMYCYGRDLEGYRLFSKNLVTGEEKNILAIDNNSYGITGYLGCHDGIYLMEAVTKDDEGRYSVVTYDSKKNKFSYYDNRRILGASDNLQRILLYEPVGIYEDALKTVYCLDILEGKIQAVTIETSEEADENHLIMSDNGKYLLTECTTASGIEVVEYEIATGKRKVVAQFNQENVFYHGSEDGILIIDDGGVDNLKRYDY